MRQESRFNGQKLLQLRKERAWSQEQLAKLADVSISHISQLEKGSRKNPSIDLVYRLSEALSVSIYVLLDLPNVSYRGELHYPSRQTGGEAEQIADHWVAWGRKLRPDLHDFLLSDQANEYITFAKELYDNRTSSKRVFQLVSDLMEKMDDRDTSAKD